MNIDLDVRNQRNLCVGGWCLCGRPLSFGHKLNLFLILNAALTQSVCQFSRAETTIRNGQSWQRDVPTVLLNVCLKSYALAFNFASKPWPSLIHALIWFASILGPLIDLAMVLQRFILENNFRSHSVDLQAWLQDNKIYVR